MSATQIWTFGFLAFMAAFNILVGWYDASATYVAAGLVLNALSGAKS